MHYFNSYYYMLGLHYGGFKFPQKNFIWEGRRWLDAIWHKKYPDLKYILVGITATRKLVRDERSIFYYCSLQNLL